MGKQKIYNKLKKTLEKNTKLMILNGFKKLENFDWDRNAKEPKSAVKYLGLFLYQLLPTMNIPLIKQNRQQNRCKKSASTTKFSNLEPRLMIIQNTRSKD